MEESLFIALNKKEDEIFDYLLDYYEGDINGLFSPYDEDHPPILMFAAFCGTAHAFQKLLDRGADPLVHHRGLNALHMATRKRNYEIVEFLIQKKVIPIDSPTQDEIKVSALGSADLRMAKLLVEGGADINYQSSTGMTPMHYAVSKKNFKFVELLLSSPHPYLNLPSAEGHTPLDLARMQKSELIIQLLCEATGEDFSMEDSSSDEEEYYIEIEGGLIPLSKYLKEHPEIDKDQLLYGNQETDNQQENNQASASKNSKTKQKKRCHLM